LFEEEYKPGIPAAAGEPHPADGEVELFSFVLVPPLSLIKNVDLDSIPQALGE
jgi:hypothetical protein